MLQHLFLGGTNQLRTDHDPRHAFSAASGRVGTRALVRLAVPVRTRLLNGGPVEIDKAGPCLRNVFGRLDKRLLSCHDP